MSTSEIPALLDTALSVIPAGCLIARLIGELRELHAAEPDWHAATGLGRAANYGYDRYPGNCHVVPNHALIILALLYGGGDFQRSMLIVNTSGWDTDCNAGNLGCLLGIMHGLDGLETGPDWRSPLADRLYLPTAEGGRAITDAAREAVWVANLGRQLHGQPPTIFKGGARFHFELPGSVQGFEVAQEPDAAGTLIIRNVLGHSRDGERSLELRYGGLALGRSARALTPTFSPLDMLSFAGRSAYDLIASPTLYPGQRLRAVLEADAANAAAVSVSLMIEYYGAQDRACSLPGPVQELAPGQAATLDWTVPEVGGHPISKVGLQLRSVDGRRTQGAVYLDALGWTGMPETTFTRPSGGGTLWRQAWVNAVDLIDDVRGSTFGLIQNRGRGLISQGTREWTDYRAEATLTPHLSDASGLALRIQGLQRYYALLLTPGALRLVKVLGGEQVLEERPFDWHFGEPHRLVLEARGPHLRGWVDDRLMFEYMDEVDPVLGGGVGLVIEQGRLDCGAVRVSPVKQA